MEPNVKTRRFPMNKPEGFVPGVQRYSARLSPEIQSLQILHLGVQSKTGDFAACLAQLREARTLFDGENGPLHFDFAKYTDPQGYLNVFAIAYWNDPASYEQWKLSGDVSDWWRDERKTDGDTGYFWEAFTAPVEQSETIAFKEYIRGLSACPFSKIEAMGESGYWGAARDRIPASGNDTLASDYQGKLSAVVERTTLGKRITVTPPQNFVVIRSGVSWEACGEEQRSSYEANIKPKLDRGMEYLRNNPAETGCCTLRQADVISIDGEVAPEGYSIGHFLSLHDLETWAKEHPTHLAIYTRAMAERQKYGERLELRTYHEIFVIPEQGGSFEYVNCHEETGLLRFFAGA